MLRQGDGDNAARRLIPVREERRAANINKVRLGLFLKAAV
jgi:hypothetical protein